MTVATALLGRAMYTRSFSGKNHTPAPVFDSLGIWRPVRVVRGSYVVRKVSLMKGRLGVHEIGS